MALRKTPMIKLTDYQLQEIGFYLSSQSSYNAAGSNLHWV